MVHCSMDSPSRAGTSGREKEAYIPAVRLAGSVAGGSVLSWGDVRGCPSYISLNM